MELNCVYDFETLSQKVYEAPILCLAYIEYDADRFVKNPYTWKELCDNTLFIKFDVEEQVKKFGLKIQKETVDWWAKQDKEVRKIALNPSPDDRSITELDGWFKKNTKIELAKNVFTRGNTFDPIILENILNITGHGPLYNFHRIRDTRSYIDGMTLGAKIFNKFMPDGCEGADEHNPIDDVCLDVMRMQQVHQTILGDDDGPF